MALARYWYLKRSSELSLWVAASFAGILGVSGYRAIRRDLTMAKQLASWRAIDEHPPRMAFLEERGIDIDGARVLPLPPPTVQITAIFMLRGASFTEDIAFWSAVQHRCSRVGGIRLVAYCDGLQCVGLARTHRIDVTFPVIAYGEVGSSQALMDEDIAGNAILRKEEWLRPKLVSWRSASSSPNTLADILSEYK